VAMLPRLLCTGTALGSVGRVAGCAADASVPSANSTPIALGAM